MNEKSKEWKEQRVMVVDDEEFCIAAMRGMLNTLGINAMYHVDFCINGQDAYDRFIEAYKKGFVYSLIFTDFQMPVINGIDCTKKIRAFLNQ